ncbi:MAG TPA: NAD-dependent epimerase/dehydratase family protein, partial [Myxococcales bacterium]|nr:NAD-dependent epimerase/dehydratase family protein [Myxococcales bacterium]
MRVLVTGAGGFVGRHLCGHLAARGDQPVPIGWPDTSREDGSKAVDITDAEAVLRAVEAAAPDAVVHLAGLSSVAASHRDPPRTFAVNALGAVNLISAIDRVAPKARLLLVGSSE